MPSLQMYAKYVQKLLRHKILKKERTDFTISINQLNGKVSMTALC